MPSPARLPSTRFQPAPRPAWPLERVVRHKPPFQDQNAVSLRCKKTPAAFDVETTCSLRCKLLVDAKCENAGRCPPRSLAVVSMTWHRDIVHLVIYKSVLHIYSISKSPVTLSPLMPVHRPIAFTAQDPLTRSTRARPAALPNRSADPATPAASPPLSSRHSPSSQSSPRWG